MPHRVVDFFLSPNDSIHTLKHTVQRHTTPAVSRTARSKERHRSLSPPPYGSDDSDCAVEVHTMESLARKRKSPKEKSKEHHRLGFAGLHFVGHRSQKDLTQNPCASLDLKIESGPALMYGIPEDSTGALISGQLLLCVKEEPLEVEALEAKLEIHTTHKKPFNNHCHDCANQKRELKSWTFLSEPLALTQRTHEYPFSQLLDGSLPATTNNHLISIEYVFTAEARLKNDETPLKMSRTIDVRRSLPVPEIPHHSLRVFPPTNIKASVQYNSVVHPHASSGFTLRLDGIGKHNSAARSVEYWKLKRLSWKLEEHVSTVAPACPKHAPKPSSCSGETGEDGSEAKKGAKRTDSRTIAHADMQSGWKADYYSVDGSIEAEIDYNVGCPSRHVCCDMRRDDGTSVTHRLVVEMVVAQEYAPLAHTRHVTPTGIARILRMNFGVVVTDRAGLGVSWDNEAPPIYQDVPLPPPSYDTVLNDVGVEDVDPTLMTGSAATMAIEGERPSTYPRESPDREPPASP